MSEVKRLIFNLKVGKEKEEEEAAGLRRSKSTSRYLRCKGAILEKGGSRKKREQGKKKEKTGKKIGSTRVGCSARASKQLHGSSEKSPSAEQQH